MPAVKAMYSIISDHEVMIVLYVLTTGDGFQLKITC